MQSAMLFFMMGALLCITSAAPAEPWEFWHRNLQQIDDGLHVVFADGSQDVFLIEEGQLKVNVVIDGTASHTHRSGASLVAYYWTDLSTGKVIGRGGFLSTTMFGVGRHTVSLTIQDNFGDRLSANFPFTVALLRKVPGTLVRIYDGINPAGLSGPAKFGFVSGQGKGFAAPVSRMPGRFKNFLLRMQGHAIFPANAVITIVGARPGSKPWLYIDKHRYDEGISPKLSPGRHYVEFRCFLLKRSSVYVRIKGKPLPLASVDLTNIAPIIHDVISGAPKPGQPGEVSGFMLQKTTLFIGGARVAEGASTVDSFKAKTFVWPGRSAGLKDLYAVKDTNGRQSNVLTVKYRKQTVSKDFGGPFSNKVQFVQSKFPISPLHVTTGSWVTRMVFCHGVIYTSVRRNGLPGQIWKLVVNDNYDVVRRELVVLVPEPMNVILGLACDPRDDDESFKLYFTHSKLPPSGTLDPKTPNYQSAVSYVKPNSPAPRPVVAVIRNLGVSNHDHAANGLAFLQDGRLLIAMSGNTNAGIPHVRLGNLYDGPTVGLVLVADIRNPGYNGKLTYSFLPNAPLSLRSKPGLASQQVHTGWVKCDNNFVKPFIYGARVPFGLIVSLTGKVILDINGPNDGWGGEMTGLDPSTLEPIPRYADPNKGPQTFDGLWYDVKEGCYLGHPNVALCRGGHKPSCSFISLAERFPPANSGFCQPKLIMPPAATGMLEYESHAFGGTYKHHIFIADYLKSSWRFNPLSGVGQPDSASAGTYPATKGIDMFHAPGGVHLVSQYDDGDGFPQTSSYVFNKPVDNVLAASGNPSAYDIIPNKGSKSQPRPNTFVIGGMNFNKMTGPVTVMFGLVKANNVRVVGTKWIKGNIPSNPGGGCPVALQVKYGSTTINMPGVFCYLNDLQPIRAPPLVR